MTKELKALERLKTAPFFMGGTTEYKMCSNSETLLIEDYEIVKQALLKAQEQEKVIEIIKPLCEVVETPVKKYRYLKMNGVVVYTFKSEKEFELLKRWLNEKDN